MKIRINKEFLEVDLPNMSKEELIDLKLKVDNEILYVKNQIEDAKAKLITDGEYSDPKWYSKINGARRFLGIASQKIQAEMAKRKQKNQKDFHCAFVDVAKRRLSPELFNEIVEETKDNQFNR